MNYLKVNLWGNEIGRLVWNPAAKAAYFVYNPANAAALPDVAPLLSPAATRNIHLPIYGDTALCIRDFRHLSPTRCRIRGATPFLKYGPRKTKFPATKSRRSTN